MDVQTLQRLLNGIDGDARIVVQIAEGKYSSLGRIDTMMDKDKSVAILVLESSGT